MNNLITIAVCLSLGTGTLFLADFHWKVIGATIVFFGCWLLCLHAEKKRINQEIDRYMALESGRQILGRSPAKSGQKDPVNAWTFRKWSRLRPLFWTENSNRVILLDSRTSKG